MPLKVVTLFDHQKLGVAFLAKRTSAMLADEMGLGKSRQALEAASRLYAEKRIDRALVLCPAAVRFSWGEELGKLALAGSAYTLLSYDPDKRQMMLYVDKTKPPAGLPLAVVSYGLLPQERHVSSLSAWLARGDALLICDESSFLKNRNAKQSKGALQLAIASSYRWLLTGTPVANSPIDLYMQGKVMAPGSNGNGGTSHGPLAGINSFYHFRAKYFIMGGFKQKQAFTNEEKLPELTKRFAPYVLRREKKDCLDLPEKTYVVREVALSKETWKIYQELKREALLCLPNSDAKPEPNAAVRILRLCQLTSGHVGTIRDYHGDYGAESLLGEDSAVMRDVSSEKLDYLTESIISGELVGERALIVWCRWRRERERLNELLKGDIVTYEIHGGQSSKERDTELFGFTKQLNERRVLLAQPHAGGFGLNLTQASTAVFLSNDFSYTTREQASDRIHRIGQKNTCTYVDILATGPKSERTVDYLILKVLQAKKSLAELTCNAWRRILE